jgi:NAD(P)-dependent dehydrogenase (short-subunit alcohol dehydrogenase family)
MINVFSVEKKIAVITGGLGQLGMAYAEAFVEQGARVAALDLTRSPKGDVAGFERLSASGRFCSYVADVTRRNTLEKVLDNIRKDLGEPDILINNAALDSPPSAPESEVGPFESYPEASFDAVMDVNVKGTVLCCQVFGGSMAVRGQGSIINISSIYGVLSPCQDIYEFRRKDGGVFFKPVVYSVSKSAIMNLTRYLATYWAKSGVRVNTLTLAGVFNNQPREFLEAYTARMPMGRMADVQECVGPVLFLASDASSYMTGANLVVDGGWTAW